MVDRTEIFPYTRIRNAFTGETVSPKLDGTSKFKSFVTGSQIKLYATYSVVGFLLGRAVILDTLSPFALAFLAVAIIYEANLSIVALSILCGALSIGQTEILIKYVFSGAMLITLYIATHKVKINKKALITTFAIASNLTVGYFVFYIKDYFMYDFLMVAIESLLIGVFIYVYDTAFPLLKNIQKRSILSSEEIISISILIAFCFVGADFNIMDLSIKNISIIFLVMIFSYMGSAGTGASLGIILGIVQALSGSILPTTIGVYGLCGLLCGILKGIGKFAIPIAFIIGNALMTFYINGSTEVLIKFYEILIASLIFIAIPQSAINKIFSFRTAFSTDYLNDKSFNKRLKEHTKEKLSEIAEVFNELAVTLKDSVKNKEYFSQTDVAHIVDQAVNKCCTSCGMCNSCWKRDFYKSYQSLFNILSTIENEGEIDMKYISLTLKDMCIKPEELINTLKHYYDLYRNSLSWKKKINDSRLVVCDQLREVSSVMSSLATQVNMDINFNREMEEIILIALDNEGIRANQVIVTQSGSLVEADIRMPSCGGRRDCIRDIIPLINRATNKKFVKSNTNCGIDKDNSCGVKLKEAQKYQIATGLARKYKSDAISGDNYSFMELRDGKYMLALSDGMGTGALAAQESNTTIRLLEKFLYAGFHKDVAVKTINSLLLVKSNEESYATIDMTVINQYNGEVEFVKVGAVSTFIKHEDGVDIIRAGSLPVGILNTIEMEFVRRKVRDGDFVIMITDGLLDCNKDDVDKEQWFADIIEDINTRNPQRMADEIMLRCLDYNGGYVEDDMTVSVAKVWEGM